MGHFPALSLDWVVAPIYIGEQDPAKERQDPGNSSNPSQLKGTDDGNSSETNSSGIPNSAVPLLIQEGFPVGTTVYLDIETSGAQSQSELDYISAWCTAVSNAGYTPGVYCLESAYASIATVEPSVSFWISNPTDPSPAGTSFPTMDPSGSGVAGAAAWQYQTATGYAIAIPTSLLPAGSLKVDLDVAQSTLASLPTPVATQFKVTAPSTATSGTAISVSVTAEDSNGNTVTSYSGMVHFTSTDTAASLPSNSTLTNGTGTFSVTLNSTGSKTVTATDTTTSSITGVSGSITVSAATPVATQFKVAAPSTATSGTAISVVVTAEDANGNTVTGYSGTLHFTSTDTAASLPSNSTLTNGTGTFSVTLNSTGSKTITATDTVTSSITGSSGSITVTSETTSSAPLIKSQPQPTSAPVNGSAQFSVTASGTGLTYQWNFNGAALTDGKGISGSTTATLSLTDIQAANGGVYSVVVSGVLASGLNSPGSLASDGSTVFFSDSTATNGLVKSVSQSGSAVSTLYSGLDINDNGTYRVVNQLQVAGNNLYGAYGDYTTLDVFEAPKAGGAIRTLAQSSGGSFVGVVGSNVYYMSGFSLLNQVPIGGGNPSVVASGYYFRGTTCDAGGIYFVDYNTKNVNKFDVTSNTVSTLISGNSSEGGIFADANYVYFNLDGSISRVSKSGGQVVALVTSGSANGYASDGTNIYYVDGKVIRSMPVLGGPPVDIAMPGANAVSDIIADSSGAYWGDLSQGAGLGRIWKSVASNAVALTVTADTAPTITTQPASQTVNTGSGVVLSVEATSNLPSTYQWYFNGTPISGATGTALSLSNVTTANAGVYTVDVTNSAGTTPSSSATLTVSPAPVSSVIATQPMSQTVNSGGSVVFTVQPNGSLQSSLRAAVAGLSPDAASGITYQWQFNGVNLSDGNGISGSTGPQLMIQGVGASDNGDYDCIVTTGGTAVRSNSAGLQVETVSNPGAVSSISSRAFVGTGDNILIGGFYIVGSTSATVLVQAIGPALAVTPYNVTGTLQKPALTIHQYQNGKDVVLYSNTGWGSSPVLLAAAAAVYAEPVLQPNAPDSEVLLTLPPGGYTAEVTGADGGTGVALCGIYQLP